MFDLVEALGELERFDSSAYALVSANLCNFSFSVSVSFFGGFDDFVDFFIAITFFLTIG